MNFIEQLQLGQPAFYMWYHVETRNKNWHAFHAHQGLELLYVYEGVGSVTVENKVYPLQPGMFFIFQPYQLHKVEVPLWGDASYLRTNLTFDLRIINPYIDSFPKLQAFVRLLAKGTLPQQVFNLENDPRLEDLFTSFHQAQLKGTTETLNEDRILFLIALLRYLQIDIIPQNESVSAGVDKGSLHIERILDWLENHYKQPFGLEAMSSDLHLSPYHLSHLFKRQVGTTITDYITGLRMREACSLLINTDKSVSQISYDVGGFSSPYFCKLFKKHQGLTPQKYRSRARRAFEQS